jgi:hypothetical protein
MSYAWALATADAETQQQATFADVIGVPVEDVQSFGPAITGLCVFRVARRLSTKQRKALSSHGYKWAFWRMRNRSVSGRYTPTIQGWH